MTNLYASFTAELLKQRRSKIFLISICLFIFIPIMMGFLMYIAQHPEIGSKMGLISAKASFFKENSWNAFFDMLNQTIAAIGMIGFGFVTAWVFGREYTEQTIKDILALPISRSAIVYSKYIVIFIWCTILALILFISGVIIGKLIHIPEWTPEVFYQSVSTYFVTFFLTILLSTIVSFIASVGRGIIAPIGLVIVLLIIAQFAAIAGLGSYFPWSIPGIYTISDGTQGYFLSSASYIILATTSLTGFIGTVAWWRYADQH